MLLKEINFSLPKLGDSLKLSKMEFTQFIEMPTSPYGTMNHLLAQKKCALSVIVSVRKTSCFLFFFLTKFLGMSEIFHFVYENEK